MKQFIIAIVIAASIGGMVLLSSCKHAKGNGKVITEMRYTKPFTELYVEGLFPIELSQDTGGPWVKVVADENLQNLVIVENINGRLSITMEEKASVKSKEFKVYVNVGDLHELTYKSIGALRTKDTLRLDSLQINSESVGRINLNVNADYIRANLNNIGSTTLRGNVREARINTESVGALKAFGLKADDLMIHNTGIGSVEIYADSTFRIRSSAVGSVTYKGPGVVEELSSEGVGKVKHID